MSYVGGKARHAEFILNILNDPQFDGMRYLEPFIGMAHIISRVQRKQSYRASDNCQLLVILLGAIQKGEPLPTITRDEYCALKVQPDSLRKATAAITYSFNGKLFGGFTEFYHRKSGRVDNIPQSRKNYYHRLARCEGFQKATLDCRDYRTHHPHGCLIYCDPPYARFERRATQYGVAFDTETFWVTMREWSKYNVVFISEYQSPPDFVCIASHSKPCTLAGGHRQIQRTERLFTHVSTLPRLNPRIAESGLALT